MEFFRLFEKRQESPSKSRQRPNVFDSARHRAVCNDWRLLRCSGVFNPGKSLLLSDFSRRIGRASPTIFLFAIWRTGMDDESHAACAEGHAAS